MQTTLNNMAECGLQLEAEPGRVQMAGEIDISTTDELAAGLDAAVTQDHRLVLDLTKVRFIDLSGARQLVECARRRRPDQVCVLGAPGSLAIILDVAGWTSELPLLAGKEAVLQ